MLKPGQIIDRAIETLKPNPRNARTHGKRQVDQIADSIREFGFTNPVLIDESNRILAGHGRVKAAKLLGMESVPTLLICYMTDAQKKAYALADNRLAEKAGWDQELLRLELGNLLEFDAEFDITITGFETPEIDVLIGTRNVEGNLEEADEIPEPEFNASPVSRPGDLWRLGQHRLLCGDARDRAAFANVLGGRLARMVFTDPPYNVRIDGNVCGLGRIGDMDHATP